MILKSGKVRQIIMKLENLGGETSGEASGKANKELVYIVSQPIIISSDQRSMILDILQFSLEGLVDLFNKMLN